MMNPPSSDFGVMKEEASFGAARAPLAEKRNPLQPQTIAKARRIFVISFNGVCGISVAKQLAFERDFKQALRCRQQKIDARLFSCLTGRSKANVVNLHSSIFLAYVDPGTGSLILQMIIASIVGVAAFFRNSIFGIFKRRKPPAKNPEVFPPSPSDASDVS